jgi:hypothetical protein
MRSQYRKYAVWGAAFAVLITLGAATAAFTAGAAPFQAEATTTIVTTITTGSSTVVSTIVTTTADSTSTDTTATDTTSTDTTTTTEDSGGGGTAPAATPSQAEPKFTG